MTGMDRPQKKMSWLRNIRRWTVEELFRLSQDTTLLGNDGRQYMVVVEIAVGKA